MSFQTFALSLNDLENLSLFTLALGASLLFFGKVIASAKVEQYEKYDYYITGLFFSVVNIGVPFWGIWFITQIWKFSNSFPFFIWVQLGIQAVISYFLYIAVNFNFSKSNLFGKHESSYVKVFQQNQFVKQFLGEVARAVEFACYLFFFCQIQAGAAFQPFPLQVGQVISKIEFGL